MFANLPSTTNTFGFGSKPAASTGFGSTGFGSPPAAKPAFGGFGTPTPAAATPAFGSTLGGGFGGFGTTGFGTPAAQPTTAASAPSFGALGGFGQPSATVATQSMPSGPIAQALQKISSAYAPFVDPSGRFVATAQQPGTRRNDECKFKTVILIPRDGQNGHNMSGFGGSGMGGEMDSLSNFFERDEYDEHFFPQEQTGIESLHNKFTQQAKEIDQTANQSQKVLEVLETAATANAQLNKRYESLALRQLELVQQAMRVMRKLEVLRCHNVPLQRSEIK